MDAAHIRAGNPRWKSAIVGYGDANPATLTPHPSNWRSHPKRQADALSGVLGDLGWIAPVIVNKLSGNMIDGHLRVELARQRGEPSVPVAYVELSPEQEAEALLTFDPIAALAEADRQNMDALLRAVETENSDVQELLASLATDAGLYAGAEPTADPGAQVGRAEELHAKWSTERGQLWSIGRHRLLCGDSTEVADTERLMAGVKADMVFTDPPYGVNVTGKGGTAIAGDISFTAIPFAFDAIDRHLSPRAWAYVCGGSANLMLYAKLFEKYFRQLVKIIVWDKGKTAVIRHNGYHSCFELIYYGYKEGGGGAWHGPDRTSHSADDIWRVPVDADVDRDHPTQKPIELPARAIRNSCPPHGIVFEPFAGSGSTLVAAEREGRTAYAVEMDERYVAVILERLAGMGLTPELRS